MRAASDWAPENCGLYLKLCFRLPCRAFYPVYGEERYAQGVFDVTPVDTTAAGDTYTGYFLAALAEGQPVPACMKLAAKASAIAVTRPGASPSIPWREEVECAQMQELPAKV